MSWFGVWTLGFWRVGVVCVDCLVFALVVDCIGFLRVVCCLWVADCEDLC